MTNWPPGTTQPQPATTALRAEGRLPNGGWPPTEKQVEYARSLQRRLHLTNRLLDNHCQATYGAPFADLDKAAVSRLLDEMLAWEAIFDGGTP